MTRARPVVLTRQPAQTGAVESGLAGAGHPVAYLPLTDFAVPEDVAPLRAAVRRVAEGGVAWLVLTSPNTVRALVRAGWDGTVAPATRIAVTGPGTARVLAGSGCTVTPWMPAADASAAGIVAQFPAPGTAAAAVPGTASVPPVGRRVLLPQSDLATEEVAEGLRALGWDVDRVEAYRTVPYPAAPERRLLAEAGAGAGVPDSACPETAGGTVVTVGQLAGADVVLTSPSAVRELVRRRGTAIPAGTRFFAIGLPTARAAVSVGLDLAGTAASPDAAGVLEVLRELRR